MISNSRSGTRIDEIAVGIYRISTPAQIPTGGFTFNQYVVVDDESLLFHTGPRSMAPFVLQALQKVVSLDRLRYVGFSHHENDEDGGMDAILAVAPNAVPLCGKINVMINGELYARPAQGLADGETLPLGRHILRWVDAPHLPHGWECGYLHELYTSTLFCGDLFTQPGSELPPLTASESAIFEPSEAMRGGMEYFAHAKATRTSLDRLAASEPRLLACMHGSAYRGDGARLLHALADRLDPIAR